MNLLRFFNLRAICIQVFPRNESCVEMGKLKTTNSFTNKRNL